MLDIMTAQIMYRKKYITFVFLTIFMVQMVLVGALPQEGKDFIFFLTITMLFLFGGSLLLQMMVWTQDLKERRLLLFLSLPYSRVKVGTAWLLVPLLIQAGMIILSTVPIIFWSLWVGSPGDDLLHTAWLSLIGASGWVLAFFYISYLFAEISILLSGSNIQVVLLNIVLGVALFYLFSQGIEYQFWVQSAEGAAWGFAVSLFSGIGSLVLFLCRKNYMMGIHPVHGLPQDWSVSASN